MFNLVYLEWEIEAFGKGERKKESERSEKREEKVSNGNGTIEFSWRSPAPRIYVIRISERGDRAETIVRTI